MKSKGSWQSSLQFIGSMTSDAKAIINGKGVNESEKLKIFEPYYTTKSDANATETLF